MRRRATVITGAEESPAVQLRRRQIRYTVLMSLRAVCLVLAAVLVANRVPFVLLWVLLLTVGMVLFPWMAVLIANDRLPKQENRFVTRFHRLRRASHAVAPAAPARSLPTGTDARIVDAEDSGE